MDWPRARRVLVVKMKLVVKHRLAKSSGVYVIV